MVLLMSLGTAGWAAGEVIPEKVSWENGKIISIEFKGPKKVE
jgi:hypothetical protein